MDPHEKTEAPRLCLDSDVVIAGLFTTEGASHALVVLGEMGLPSVVLPNAAVEEGERNLKAKLPEALPLFGRFQDAPWVAIHTPSPTAKREARPYAHPKDALILAAAISADVMALVTHNTRHYRKCPSLRVLKPASLLREIRAWRIRFGT